MQEGIILIGSDSSRFSRGTVASSNSRLRPVDLIISCPDSFLEHSDSSLPQIETLGKFVVLDNGICT